MTKGKATGVFSGDSKIYGFVQIYYNRKYESLICVQALRRQTKSGEGGRVRKLIKLLSLKHLSFQNHWDAKSRMVEAPPVVLCWVQ